MEITARATVDSLDLFGFKKVKLWNMLYHYSSATLAGGENARVKDTNEPLTPRAALVKRSGGELCVVHPDSAKLYVLDKNKLFAHAGKIYLAWDGEKVLGGGGMYTTPDGWDDGDGGFISAGKHAGQIHRLPTVITRFTVNPEVFEVSFAPKASEKLLQSFADRKIGQTMCVWGVSEMIKAQTTR